jgi:hypothetical protein
MDLEQTYRDMVSSFSVVESPWTFDTSAGAELVIGTPVARVAVAGTMGAIWVRYHGAGKSTRLTYGGAGASLGVSLVPFPGNFSFSIPQMPSGGMVYKLPFAGKTLSLSELRGVFLLFELAADWGPGASGAVMFIGGNPVLASLVGPGLYVLAMLATSKACVRFGGMTANALPVNASASVYTGLIQ